MIIRSIVTDAPQGGVQIESRDVDYSDFPVILKPILTGICGTDRGIVNGALPFAYNPHGENRLILGHESLSMVISAEPNQYNIKAGDIVVPMVRRPGKCLNCLVGRSDNCSDGQKHEAGVTGLHGFMRDEFGDFPEYLVRVPGNRKDDLAVLTEPVKNVEKVFEVLDIIFRRSIFTDSSGAYDGKRAVVIGTGSEGFLFALKSMDYGFSTGITNRHSLDNTKAKLVEDTGMSFYDYARTGIREENGIDLLIDTSGDPGTVFRFLRKMNNNGIVVLFGTNGKAGPAPVDGEILGSIVEKNLNIVGSVDGARIHYERALQDIYQWKAHYGKAMETMITARVSPDDTGIFLKKPADEIKTVISWE